MMQYPQWLYDFFELNLIRLDAIIKQQYKEPRQSLFDALLFPITQQRTYFALPYVENKKQPVRMYVGGVHEYRVLLELKTIIKNAVGSAYIEHCELISIPTIDDTAVNILLKDFPIGIVRLTFFANMPSDDILKGFYLIQHLIQILNRRPVLTQMRKRPIGRILREFHLAKEEGDIRSVLNCFEEIKLNASLGAKNLIFLEIQTLAISGKWAEIRQHSQLKHLIDDLMPSFLLQNILDALGQAGGDLFLVIPFDEIIDIKALQKEYQKFSPIFTRLLELPKEPKYRRQWQQWIIGSILLGQHQYLEQLPKFIDLQWCGQLVQKVKNYGYFIKKRESKDRGLKLTVPQSLEQTRIYLNYCTSLAPEDWSDIWFYLSKISLEMRSYLDQDPYLKEKWELIEAYCDKKIVYEWNNWFEQVIQSQRGDIEKLLIKLHNEYRTWTTKSFVESQLVKVLNSNLEQTKVVMCDTLPILLDWLVENQVNLAIETILLLFSLLVDDEKNDPNDLRVFYELVVYWRNLRRNSDYDHQVIISTELLLKKCHLNPLFQLPIYQRRVEQIVDMLKFSDDIKPVGIQSLEEFLK